jgi:hypothetical protein
MESKTYKDYFFTEEAYIRHKNRTDKKIKAYNNIFMNNSKWKRLFLTIFSNTDFIKYCEVNDFFSSSIIILKTNLQNIEYEKYIHNDCIDNRLFKTGEYSISYREIEYIEFKKYWREEAKMRLQSPKIIEQDTNKIKEIISETGKYEWGENEKYLRIIGYKKP